MGLPTAWKDPGFGEAKKEPRGEQAGIILGCIWLDPRPKHLSSGYGQPKPCASEINPKAMTQLGTGYHQPGGIVPSRATLTPYVRVEALKEVI